jgi:hypothetical protein
MGMWACADELCCESAIFVNFGAFPRLLNGNPSLNQCSLNVERLADARAHQRSMQDFRIVNKAYLKYESRSPKNAHIDPAK